MQKKWDTEVSHNISDKIGDGIATEVREGNCHAGVFIKNIGGRTVSDTVALSVTPAVFEVNQHNLTALATQDNLRPVLEVLAVLGQHLVNPLLAHLFLGHTGQLQAVVGAIDGNTHIGIHSLILESQTLNCANKIFVIQK